MLWSMVTDLVNHYKNTITGRYDNSKSNKILLKVGKTEMTGGAKIKLYFYSLFS